VYPADPDALKQQLHAYEHRAGAVGEPVGENLAGLITPHIDYGRGGSLSAALWRRAEPAVRAADVVVIFGTDHHGSPGRLTLTRQSYATPWGVLPTEQRAVDALVDVLGEEPCFAEELHHRAEHSVELAAVWLHHIRDGEPLPLVPVLCGHPGAYMRAGAIGAETPAGRAVAALREALAGRRVLAVAAADLAPAGP